MQNPIKTTFVIFLILLLCFSNIHAQKKLSDFTYQIQTSKSLEIDIYHGENGVFWIKTKNNPSNEDELSVFDPQKGEIVVIKDNKLPKKIFIRQFYQSKNLGFFIMQNQENFLPFFVVINQEGKILEKKDLLANLDLNPKLVGIKNEVYFTVLNDLYKYDFDKLQFIEIPKQNNISIQLSQNHSLYKSQNDWLISDNDLLITSKKVIKASTFFNDSQYNLHQIEDQLLAKTKNGLFEVQVIDGQPVLENVSNITELFFAGKYNGKYVFGKYLNSGITYFNFENKKIIDLQDEIPDKKGVFFENDSIKLVFGVNGGFAEPAWYYSSLFYSKIDSVDYPLLNFMDRRVKYSNFEISSNTSIFKKTENLTSLIIKGLGKPDRIITFRNKSKNKNPYIVEKVTEQSTQKWIVKDFINYFYYFDTQTLEIELIKDPYEDRNVTNLAKSPIKIGSSISIGEDYFYLPYLPEVNKKPINFLKDTITIKETYPNIEYNPITLQNLYTSQNQTVYFNYVNGNRKIKFVKRENEYLFLQHDNDTIKINIGLQKNSNFPVIYVLSTDELIISFNGVNIFHNLKIGSKFSLKNGFLNFLAYYINEPTKKILFRIYDNTEVDHFYFLEGEIKTIPELKNKWFNFVLNSNQRILYYNKLNSMNDIVSTEYFDIENLNKIYLPYKNLTTFHGFNWPYLITQSNLNYNTPNKIEIINIEEGNKTEISYPNSVQNTYFKIKNENIYFTYYDVKSGSYKFIRTDLNLKKNYELTWKLENSFNDKENLVLSKGNRRILLNLDNFSQIFELGQIKNDYYNISIDEYDTDKTPYWFGNLASWDNTNLFQLEKSDIKYEDLEWIELEEDWSFSEINEKPQTAVYPNPNNGYLNIFTEELLSKITLLDNLGKPILEMENSEINGNVFQNQDFIRKVEEAAGWKIRNTNSPVVYFVFSFANGKKMTKKIITTK